MTASRAMARMTPKAILVNDLTVCAARGDTPNHSPNEVMTAIVRMANTDPKNQVAPPADNQHTIEKAHRMVSTMTLNAAPEVRSLGGGSSPPTYGSGAFQFSGSRILSQV